MRIAAVLVMALAVSGVGTAGANFVDREAPPLVFGCGEGIVTEGGCCTGGTVYQWNAFCNYVVCSPAEWWDGCANSCCDGDVWVVEEGCTACGRF